MNSKILRLAAMLMLLLSYLDARAGGRLPCQEARVFREAAVNAFVLPYRDARSDTQPHGSPGWRLPVLIQQEVLMSLLKYGSVGVTELTQTGPEVCDPREVIKRTVSGNTTGGAQFQFNGLAAANDLISNNFIGTDFTGTALGGNDQGAQRGIRSCDRTGADAATARLFLSGAPSSVRSRKAHAVSPHGSIIVTSRSFSNSGSNRSMICWGCGPSFLSVISPN